LTVTAVNDAPVAVDGTATTAEDTLVEITLVASDVDSPTLSYSIVAGPAHGTLSSVTGTNISYTPALNYNGSDTFTFKANDSNLDSNTATVTLTITAVNDAPIAVNDAYSTNEDTTLTVAAPGVLSNDTDIDTASSTAV